MAIVTASFSIRGYAERMRSVDLGRCWPFGDGREDTTPPLPAIPVRRFRWWIDELDMLRSEAAAELVSEADDLSPPAQTLPAGEEARRTGKGKQKALKKRSMVELFAAAPLIAGAVDSSEEDCEEAGGVIQEEEEGGMDLATRKRSGINDNCLMKKKGRKKKKKGIREGFKMEIRALEKDLAELG
ncbi:hypothetical protein KSP40_PGU020657 [Platanthera guangdongensis]|uniref:Uncharacterized protein n=1 Tax=Platanthera guangdongensis TaxID=2320717 RepID=A0ABR2N124_9ASPA